jgi:hypothetical protein
VESFFKAVFPALAVLAVLMIVEIDFLTLALLYFPFIFGVALPVFAVDSPHMLWMIAQQTPRTKTTLVLIRHG